MNKQRALVQSRGATRDLTAIFSKVKSGDASFEEDNPKSR